MKVNAVAKGEGGIPNITVYRIEVNEKGVVGDGFNHPKDHGGQDHPDQALCLYSLEGYKFLANNGFDVRPGDFGENVVLERVDFNNIQIGQRFRIGDVLCEITKPRSPCKTLAKEYGQELLGLIWEKEWKSRSENHYGSPKWGMSGFYARILEGGSITEGDSIEEIIKNVEVRKS